MLLQSLRGELTSDADGSRFSFQDNSFIESVYKAVSSNMGDSAAGGTGDQGSDLDGDEEFCGLSGTEEFSGFYEVAYPTFSAAVEISIQNLCAAPEILWDEIQE